MDQRQYYNNMATIMGRKIEFQHVDPETGQKRRIGANSKINPSKFAADDLSDDQKKQIDNITAQALERKRQQKAAKYGG